MQEKKHVRGMEEGGRVLTIRTADLRDYEAAQVLEGLEFRLHQQARPDYFKRQTEGYSRKEFEELLALPCPIALVAEFDGSVVGLCFGKITMNSENPVCKQRKIAFIEDLATLPEYRGRGVATALMACARELALAEGAETLELCVWGFNEEALRLYERLGMKVQYYRMEEQLTGQGEHC